MCAERHAQGAHMQSWMLHEGCTHARMRTHMHMGARKEATVHGVAAAVGKASRSEHSLTSEVMTRWRQQEQRLRRGVKSVATSKELRRGSVMRAAERPDTCWGGHRRAAAASASAAGRLAAAQIAAHSSMVVVPGLGDTLLCTRAAASAQTLQFPWYIPTLQCDAHYARFEPSLHPPSPSARMRTCTAGQCATWSVACCTASTPLCLRMELRAQVRGDTVFLSPYFHVQPTGMTVQPEARSTSHNVRVQLVPCSQVCRQLPPAPPNPPPKS